jgi:putative copper resistance protein D
MKWRVSLLPVLLLVQLFFWLSHVSAQSSLEHHPVFVTAGSMQDLQGEHGGGAWEGSAEGVAYSEFNHRFAGLLLLLFGVAEFGYALRYSLPFWTRLVLPGAFGVIGAYLLIWSDHEAWPIGSLTFGQTFSGQDPEILQHKFYGVFASTAAVSETLRRIGWVRHPAWAAPLVIGAMIGGLLLFWHSHGHHPANQTIELHHALLGCLGVGAAASSAMVSWRSGSSRGLVKRWDVAWAVFVILIGIQLLLYFE